MVSRLLERGNFDDKEDAIEKRCDTFQNECRPVLEKFADKVMKVKQKRKIQSDCFIDCKVNADQDRESVASEIAAQF